MEKINLFFKGLLIGIGKIIPGVSGSVIAISLGVYESIISFISTIYKDTKSKINFLLPLFIGIFISIILGSNIILYLLNNYYFITMMFFIGLMSGGINPIFNEIKNKQTTKNIIIMIIPIIFFLILDIILKQVNIEIKFNYINIFILGVIEAITSIIPGISGTAIMMMLGVYNNVLIMFTSITYIDKLVVFILGIIIGVILISKVINYYLTNHKTETYYAIFSFCIFSLFIIFRNLLEIDLTFMNLLLGSMLTYIGYLITSKMN
jgi:putative membrane protein